MAITDTQQTAQFAASAAVSAAEAKQYALSIEKPLIDISESVSEAKDAAVSSELARDEAKDIASGLSESINFELAEKEAEFESQMQGQRTAFEVSQQDKESDFLSSQSQREADFVESQTDRENRFQTFLDSSGYVFLGDYENGPFQFSARNQYIRYNNQYYRLNAATDVGFTTTGTDATSFANDVTHFVLMDSDTLRQNLASSEDGLGSYMVSFKRNPLAAAISTAISVATALSSISVSIWEFRNHVTDRPDAKDQNTWDWSPAVQAAYNNIGTYLPYVMGTNTRHASATLLFPPGYYRCSEQVIADYSSYSGYVYGRPRLTITGYGASIGCGVEQDFTWKVIGTLLNMSGLDFVTDPTVNYSYAMKLGDETQTTSNYAVTGVLRDIRGFNLTKFVTFGWAFDMRIEGPYATGFKQDPDVAEPATYFEILEHVSDNCNHLVFIRPQGETADTKNFEYFRINGNSHLSTHHNIHMFGGHFESHQYGIKFVNAVKNASGRPAVHQCSFNGVVFLENGSGDAALDALTPAASTNLLTLDQSSCIELNCCRVATTNTTTETFDSSKHKALIKYSGSALSLVIRGGYFVTAFASVAGSNQNRYTLIDISEHSAGKRAVEFAGRYSMNNFSTAHSTGRVLSGWTSGNRKWIEEVSDDGLEYSWSYSTSSDLTGTPTKVFSVDSSGTFSVNGIKVSTFDASTVLRIGYNNTTPGQRSINFYGAGTTDLTGQVYSNSSGSIIVTSTNNIFLSPNGGSGETMYTGNLKPNATGSYSLGTSSFYPNNIYSQNAVTVVCDVNYKANVKVLSDEEEYQTLISAVGIVPFSAWQLKSAIAEKGADSARWHVGVIAQQVKSAITDAGLDWTKYGVIIYESFSQAVTKGDNGYYYPVVDEEEAPEIPVNASGYIDAIDGADSVITADDGTITYTREIYMLRMEEFFTLRMAYIERKFS